MQADEPRTDQELDHAVRTRTAQPQRKSGMDRRRESDNRKRETGHVRLHAWVKAERLDDLRVLLSTWDFQDRAEVVDFAIRYLREKSESMDSIPL